MDSGDTGGDRIVSLSSIKNAIIGQAAEDPILVMHLKDDPDFRWLQEIEAERSANRRCVRVLRT